jgi:hypothetical protein
MSLSKLDRAILEFVAEHPACSLITIDNCIENYSKSSIRDRVGILKKAGYLTNVVKPTYKISSDGKAAMVRNNQ